MGNNECLQMPPRLEYKLYNGDSKRYLSAIYSIFKKDFVDGDVFFQGKRVDIIHEKYYDGKERSFWHIVTQGESDSTRNFDTERCASLPYVKALISEITDCKSYLIWKKYHDETKKDRWYIFCTTIRYMVVLEDRNSFFKLITAFNVAEYNMKRYQKDYQKYKDT